MSLFLAFLLSQSTAQLVGFSSVAACDADPLCTLDSVTGNGTCPAGYDIQPEGFCEETPPPPCDEVQLELDAQNTCSNGYILNTTACTFSCNAPAGAEYDNVPIPPPEEWVQIPGSAPAPGVFPTNDPSEPWGPYCTDIKCWNALDSFLAWTGMVFDEERGRWLAPAFGGHRDHGGNGVFGYHFGPNQWLRHFDPQPLDGLPMFSSSSVLLNDCPRPAVGPPSIHNYGGAVFVPPNSTYPDGLFVVLGTIPYCKDFIANRQELEGSDPIVADPYQSVAWGVRLDNPADLWVRLPNTLRTSRPAATLDSFGYLVVLTDTDNRLRVYDTTTWAVTKDVSFTDTGRSVIDLDEVDRGAGHGWMWVGIDGLGLYRRPYTADANGNPEVANNAAKERVADWATAPFIATQVHDSTGHVYQSDGGKRVGRYCPESSTYEIIDPATGPPAPSAPGRMFTNFRYYAPLNVFFLVGRAEDGVWVWSPPLGACGA